MIHQKFLDPNHFICLIILEGKLLEGYQHTLKTLAKNPLTHWNTHTLEALSAFSLKISGFHFKVKNITDEHHRLGYFEQPTPEPDYTKTTASSLYLFEITQEIKTFLEDKLTDHQSVQVLKDRIWDLTIEYLDSFDCNDGPQ